MPVTPDKMQVFPAPNSETRNPDTVHFLRERMQKLSAKKHEPQTLESLVWKRLFPDGAPRGGIVEWLGDAGSGAATLSLEMARQACGDEGVMAIVDRPQQIYPPAMMAFGVDFRRTLLLHPESRRDETWALIQCLRCSSITVVWSCLEHLNAREYRCLQLAAEESGVIGILTRPQRVQGQPTWASVRFEVTPQSSRQKRRFEIQTISGCHGSRGNVITIERDALTGELRECHETLPVRLAPGLARSSVGRRANRA